MGVFCTSLYLRLPRCVTRGRYHKLLQEHMQCGVTIARLEAQQAELQAFMERFRSALRKEEHDQ